MRGEREMVSDQRKRGGGEREGGTQGLSDGGVDT